MKKVILVDGFGIIFKAYYAFINRPLRNKRGENTSAVFGFYKAILSILKKENPDFFLIALEGKGKCFRNEIYPAYKANRPAAPEDLKPQIIQIISLLEKLEIPHLSQESYEADDIIGTLAEQLKVNDEIEIIILSSDKDLRQLVLKKNIFIYKPDKSIGDFIKLDRQKIYTEMNVYPEQVCDYLALVGDSVDNIPGVAGIGAKTAGKLLNEWQDIDQIYANIEQISSKSIKTKLINNKEKAFLSKKLATIEKEIPFQFKLEQMLKKPLALENAAAVLQENNLTSIVNDIQQYNQQYFGIEFSIDSSKAAGQEADQADELQEITENYHVAASSQDLLKIKNKIKQSRSFCFDLETTGFDFFTDHIICISLAFEDEQKKIETWVVPCYISNQQKQDLEQTYGQPCIGQDCREQVFSLLKEVFEDPAITKIGQNLKFDIKFLRQFNIYVNNPLFDTMLAEYCLDASHNFLGMKELAEKYYHYQMIYYKDVVKDPKKETLLDIPFAELVRYSGQDAFVTYQLYLYLKERLNENQKIGDLFYRIEMPLVLVLTDMEYQGVLLNTDHLKNLSSQLDLQIGDIHEQMVEIAGTEFNPNSPLQIRKILFEEFKLPVVKKTKSGPSTDVDVLKKLSTVHTFPALLLEYRQLSKIKSTYSNSLPEMVHHESNRIHTTYMQTGTQTGRISSKDPNLQNIPIKTKIGREIRKAFIPAPGSVIISADYSQIELFLLAEFSRDDNLYQAFSGNEDIHIKTAALIFDTAQDKISKQQRNIAKAVNFGILYGQSGFSLAEDLNIPVAQASQFIKLYFEKYAGVKKYIDRLKEECKEKGYAETYWGRKRSIAEINDKNRFRKAYGERMAVNTTIQGTAADMIKISMVRISEQLKERQLKSSLIMQVHDELIFEVYENEKDLILPIIRQGMEEGFDFSLKLKTSVEIGQNWGELH